MTVNTTNITSGPYSGNDITTAFSYTFRVETKDQLSVYETDDDGIQTILTVDTDYTVDNLGTDAGGLVTRSAGALPTGYVWYIRSNYQGTQLIDLDSQGGFFPDVHESAFDKLTFLVQQITDRVSRSVRLTDSDTQGSITGFEAVPNAFLRFNSAGDGVEPYTANDVPVAESIPLASYVELDALLSGSYSDGQVVWITDPGVSGPFVADSGVHAADVGTVRTFGDDVNRFWRRLFSGPVQAEWYGVDGVGDNYAEMVLAMATGKSVDLSTSISISDEIDFVANDTIVRVKNGATIQQTTADKGVFKADNLDNVWVVAVGAKLRGEGSWSAGWTGNSGHGDRVIELIGCSNSGVIQGKIENGASAGISVVGGENIVLCQPTIEGTNEHSTVIPANANFQNGIYIKHDTTEGAVKNLRIISPDISGSAQGILVEGYAGFTPGEDLNNQVTAPVIHDITGQHAIYCQTGGINFSDVNIDNCYLDGVKIQDNGTVQVKDVTVTGIITNCGSHGLELQAENIGGLIDNVQADIIVRNCQRGFGANGLISNSKIRVQSVNATQYGAILQGTGIKELDLDIDSIGSGRHGVYVTAPTCTGVRITPVVRKSSAGNTGVYDGIHIADCGDVVLFDPVSTDSDGEHRYAFYGITGDIRVRGSAKFTNGTTHDIRADVDILEWPSEVELSAGTTTSRTQDIKRFTKSSQPVKTTGQSTSATNVTLWQTEMPDESAWFLKAEVVAKLSDSSERESWFRTVLCYRDAGGNVVIESQGDVQNLASAGSTAALTWENSGTTIRLRANSGGVSTYDWQSRVTYVEVS